MFLSCVGVFDMLTHQHTLNNKQHLLFLSLPCMCVRVCMWVSVFETPTHPHTSNNKQHIHSQVHHISACVCVSVWVYARHWHRITHRTPHNTSILSPRHASVCVCVFVWVFLIHWHTNTHQTTHIICPLSLHHASACVRAGALETCLRLCGCVRHKNITNTHQTSHSASVLNVTICRLRVFVRLCGCTRDTGTPTHLKQFHHVSVCACAFVRVYPRHWHSNMSVRVYFTPSPCVCECLWLRGCTWDTVSRTHIEQPTALSL